VSSSSCTPPSLTISQRLAKVLSKHTQLHGQRVERTMSVVMAKQATMIDNVAQLRLATKEASAGVSATVSDWSKDASKSVLHIGSELADNSLESQQVLSLFCVAYPCSTQAH
jgi:hypothetical protein